MREKTIVVRVITKEVSEVIVEPVCRQSVRFCQIASTKVLNYDQLFHIQKLGFQIKVLNGSL